MIGVGKLVTDNFFSPRLQLFESSLRFSRFIVSTFHGDE